MIYKKSCAGASHEVVSKEGKKWVGTDELDIVGYICAMAIPLIRDKLKQGINDSSWLIKIFLSCISGNVGIGHSRYSTAGGRDLSNTQPFVVHTRHGPLATAHNGELINAEALRKTVCCWGLLMACYIACYPLSGFPYNKLDSRVLKYSTPVLLKNDCWWLLPVADSILYFLLLMLLGGWEGHALLCFQSCFSAWYWGYIYDAPTLLGSVVLFLLFLFGYRPVLSVYVSDCFPYFVVRSENNSFFMFEVIFSCKI